jgi:hypothetical protein
MQGCSPTHDEDSTSIQDRSGNRLGQRVGELVVGGNGVDADLTASQVVTEMMQLDIEVLGSWPDLGEGSNLECSAVVFEDLATWTLGPSLGTWKTFRLSSSMRRITGMADWRA